MPYYLKKYVIKFGMIFVIAFIIASSYPRHTTISQAWGLPFEYRSQVRQEYIVPGKEDSSKVFSLSVLVTNIWLVFFGIVLLLFAAGTIYALLKRLTSTHSNY